MKYRIAKPSDAKRIAIIHSHINDISHLGVFPKMSVCFLRCYYSILLSDPNEVIICSINEKGTIIGFISGTLDSRAQSRRIKHNTIRLAIASIPSIVMHPILIKELFVRFKSLGSNTKLHYICPDGARGEYWAWDSADYKNSINSIVMREVWLTTMKILGVIDLYFEVDTINSKIYSFICRDGAVEVNRQILPDGRERVVMKYDLTLYSPKLLKLANHIKNN